MTAQNSRYHCLKFTNSPSSEISAVQHCAVVHQVTRTMKQNKVWHKKRVQNLETTKQGALSPNDIILL